MSRRRKSKDEKKALRLAMERRAGLEMTRRQYAKGKVSQEDYEELVEFWETGEPAAIRRAIYGGGRGADPVGRLVIRPLIRAMGRERKK